MNIHTMTQQYRDMAQVYTILSGECGAGALRTLPGALRALPGALRTLPGALSTLPGAL